MHKHTCGNFEHFPLLVHSFRENWEWESWFPILEKFVRSALIEGHKRTTSESVPYSSDHPDGISWIKIELAFVLCLLFGILQDSLTRSTSDQFLSFIQKLYRSHFCVCAMCFEQVRFQCWSCKLHATVNTSEAFVAQSASTFFFKQHFTIDTIVFCVFTIAMKNIHVLPFSGTGKTTNISFFWIQYVV